MKSYLIKNSAIMHNGKIFPEGSTINLEDNEAESLTNFLVPLSVSSRAESREEVSATKSKSLALEPKLELKKKDKK